MTQSGSSGFEAKLVEALGSSLSTNVQYESGSTIGAKADAGQNSAVAFVIQMDKNWPRACIA